MDFFDFSRFSVPGGIIEAQQRISYNLGYFASNYMGIIGLFFLYLVFNNLAFFIIVVVELVAGGFIQNAFGNTDELNLHIFTLHRNMWYIILLVINVPLILFYCPLSSLIWLGVFSGAIVIAHAAMMDKPVEASYSDMA